MAIPHVWLESMKKGDAFFSACAVVAASSSAGSVRNSIVVCSLHKMIASNGDGESMEDLRACC